MRYLICDYNEGGIMSEFKDKMIEFKDKLMGFCEKWGPFLIAVIVTIISFIKKIYPCNIQNLDSILSNIINLVSILMGFFATMISILIAIPSKRVIQKINRHKKMDLLIAYLGLPIFEGFVVVILSICLNPMVCQSTCASRLLLVAWVFFTTGFIFSSVRLLLILAFILKGITKENDDLPKQNVVKPDVSNAFNHK